MKVVADSTVLFHLYYHYHKMMAIIARENISTLCISRISYIEILSAASENAKITTRKFLNSFKVIEFDKVAVNAATNLSMKYRVSRVQSKDFLIAATCIAYKLPLLTENEKDFSYTGLKVLSYRLNF